MNLDLFITEPDQKLVLEIGGQPAPKAQFIEGWEGAKVIDLNVNPETKPHIIADAAQLPEELKDRFDGILASHVLEHFSYWNTEKVLQGWIDCIKEGGELHVVVPSLEWGCREVLSENPSPAVYAQLFAGQTNQWDVHLTGFTMRKLRQLFQKLGLATRVARTGVYHVHVGGWEKEFEAMQHYIVGVKGKPELRTS